jgi:hypothetical protein
MQARPLYLELKPWASAGLGLIFGLVIYNHPEKSAGASLDAGSFGN